MDNDVEAGQKGQGAQDAPHSEASQPTGKDSSSQAKQLAATLFEEMRDPLGELVEEKISRSQQSIKDKRIHQQGERLESLEGTVKALRQKMEGKGMSFDEAADELQSENRIHNVERQLEQLLQSRDNDQQPIGNRTGWAERQATILQQAGLDPNDPQVVELRREYDDPDQYIQALEREAFQMASKPRGSSADVADTSDGGVPKKDLRQEYLERKENIPRGNVKMLDELKREFRAKGLEVW